MPLKSGSSQKTVSSNISELIHSWRKKRKIGTSKPKTSAEARRQAVAIALDESGNKNK